MALAVGSELPLAGVVGCSSYPHPNWMPPSHSPPVLLLHGTQDEVVPMQASRELASSFKRKDLVVETFFFEGRHEITEEIIPTIQQRLLKWFI